MALDLQAKLQAFQAFSQAISGIISSNFLVQVDTSYSASSHWSVARIDDKQIYLSGGFMELNSQELQVTTQFPQGINPYEKYGYDR